MTDTPETATDIKRVIAKVRPWSGSLLEAFNWFRFQPIPAFGDRTPAAIVRNGGTEQLLAYLSGLEVGGYA